MSDLNENLAKLWSWRADSFDESADIAGEGSDLKDIATTYRICAKELMHPPTELFERQEPQELRGNNGCKR